MLCHFDDLKPDDDTLECLLDISDDILPDTFDLFDFASMAASLSLNITDPAKDILFELQHTGINLIEPVFIFVLLFNW